MKNLILYSDNYDENSFETLKSKIYWLKNGKHSEISHDMKILKFEYALLALDLKINSIIDFSTKKSSIINKINRLVDHNFLFELNEDENKVTFNKSYKEANEDTQKLKTIFIDYSTNTNKPDNLILWSEITSIIGTFILLIKQYKELIIVFGENTNYSGDKRVFKDYEQYLFNQLFFKYFTFLEVVLSFENIYQEYDNLIHYLNECIDFNNALIGGFRFTHELYYDSIIYVFSRFNEKGIFNFNVDILSQKSMLSQYFIIYNEPFIMMFDEIDGLIYNKREYLMSSYVQIYNNKYYSKLFKQDKSLNYSAQTQIHMMNKISIKLNQMFNYYNVDLFINSNYFNKLILKAFAIEQYCEYSSTGRNRELIKANWQNILLKPKPPLPGNVNIYKLFDKTIMPIFDDVYYIFKLEESRCFPTNEKVHFKVRLSVKNLRNINDSNEKLAPDNNQTSNIPINDSDEFMYHKKLWGNQLLYQNYENDILELFIKTGDYLIQEKMVYEIQKIFENIYNQNKIKIKTIEKEEIEFTMFIKPINCEAIVEKCGFLTYLSNTDTLKDIYEKLYDPNNQFFNNNSSIKNEMILVLAYEKMFNLSSIHHYKTALKNFLESFVGYTVFEYIFNTQDRHEENIMLDAYGRYYRIDYGFMLFNGPGTKKLGIQSEITYLNINVKFIKLLEAYAELMQFEYDEIDQLLNQPQFDKFDEWRKNPAIKLYIMLFMQMIDKIMNHRDDIYKILKNYSKLHGSKIECFNENHYYYIVGNLEHNFASKYGVNYKYKIIKRIFNSLDTVSEKFYLEWQTYLKKYKKGFDYLVDKVLSLW